MNRSLLKTVSVLAISFFAFPVMAQGYSPANSQVNVDPYGYGNVPLPPPVPQYQQMVMPSYQAQQASGGFQPLNRYSSLYAGQSSPQVVTTARYGVLPDYLPQTRASVYGQSPYSQGNVQPSTNAQASSVGYVVQPQAGAPPQALPQVAQYAPQYGAQVGAQAAQVASPYAGQAYGAAQTANTAYGAAQQAPATYGAAQNTTNQYATGQYAAPQIAAPQINVTAPQVNVQAPSSYSPNAYSPTNAAVQNSITTANYDGASSTTYQPLSSYQNASGQNASSQAVGQQAYAPQAVQQPYVGQTYSAPSAYPTQAYDTPQPQVYAYGTQPQTYTTTQIYTPSPALTVQQTADANTQAYPQAYAQNTAPVVEDVSLATDPSVGPWYYTLRSGLTLAQETELAVAGSTVTSEYQTGWQLGTGVGYEFRAWNNWLAPRVEAELVYDQQLVDAHTISGAKTSDPNAYGYQRNLNLMANGFLDFRLNRYLAPYVGGGMGVGYADFDRYGTSAAGVVIDENDVGFVWQAMGGLGINLSSNATIDFGYRYAQNTGVTIKARDGTSTTTDTGKHVLMVGFRNNF